MPPRKRTKVEPTDDWQQLKLLVDTPEQLSYELIRPVVLFGRSPAQRAKETGAAQRTIHRHAARFADTGMRSLFAPPPDTHRRLAPEIRQAILDLKADHPALKNYEITTICGVPSGPRFDHRPSPHTVERILAENTLSPPARRHYPPYHQIPDPVERRLAIVSLHSEGWSSTSIASCLEVSRVTVHATLRRWIDDGLAGMDDQSRAPKTRVRKTDLKAIAQVRTLQENPELGAFRIHTALKQIGIELSPRTCGRILALNRKLYQLRGPQTQPRELKEMPFKVTRRHQYWTVDIRYLDMHTLDGGMIYVIAILENYSRAILASTISRRQDLSAYLIVLFEAIRRYGVPEALVSDSGGVFRANQAMRIYAALGIRKAQIEKRQPWQSYIETTFNVQRRMADWHFAKAATWEELRRSHDRWMADYNFQEQWAHRKRPDNRRSPAEVLGWVTGTISDLADLQRIFYATRFGRRVNAHGSVRFRDWQIDVERGAARKQATIWLNQERMTLEFTGETLAHYAVEYETDRRHLKAVGEPQFFSTRFRSLQPPLWELSTVDWRPARRLPEDVRRRARSAAAVQAPLFLAGLHEARREA
jgi:putative transposase